MTPPQPTQQSYQCACGAVVAVTAQCQHCNMARYSQNQVADMTQQLYAMQAQIQQGNIEMAQLRFNLTDARTEQGKAADMNNMLSRQNEEVSNRLVIQRQVINKQEAEAAEMRAAIKKLQARNAVLTKEAGARHRTQQAEKQGSGGGGGGGGGGGDGGIGPDAMKSLHDKYDAANEELTSTKEELTSTKEELTSTKKQLVLAAARCDKLSSEKDAAARADEKRLAEISSLAGENAALSLKVANLEKKLKKKSSSANQPQQGQAKTKALQRSLAKLRAEIAKSSDRERSLRGKLDEFKTSASTAQEQLAEFESAATTTKEQINKVKAGFAKKEAEFAQKEMKLLENATSTVQDACAGGGEEAHTVQQTAPETGGKKKKKKKKKKGGDAASTAPAKAKTKTAATTAAEGASPQPFFVSTETLLAETQACLKARNEELKELRAARSSGAVGKLAEAAVDLLLDKAGVEQLLRTNRGLQEQHTRGLHRLVDSERQLAKTTSVLASTRSRLAQATSLFVSVESKIAAEQEAHQAKNGEENKVYTDLLLDLATFITDGGGFEHRTYEIGDVDEVTSWKMAADGHQRAARQNAMMTVHYMSTMEASLGRPHFEVGCTTPYEVMQGFGRMLNAQHADLCTLGKTFLECCTKLYPALGSIAAMLHARVGDGTISSTMHWLSTSVLLLKKACREVEVEERALDVPVIVRKVGKGACSTSDITETIYQLQEMNKFQREKLKRRTASMSNLQQTVQKLRVRLAREATETGTEAGTGKAELDAGAATASPTPPPAATTEDVMAVSLSRAVVLVRRVFKSIGLGSAVFDSGFTENTTPKLYATWLYEKLCEGLELMTGHCRNLMCKSDMSAKALTHAMSERATAMEEITSLRHVFEASGFTGTSLPELKKQIDEFRKANVLQNENNKLKKINKGIFQKLKAVNAQLSAQAATKAGEAGEEDNSLSPLSPGLGTSLGAMLPPLHIGGGGDTDVFTVAEKLLAREEDLKVVRLEMERQAEKAASLKAELTTLQARQQTFQHSEREQVIEIRTQQMRSEAAERALCETQAKIDTALFDTASIMQKHKQEFKSELDEARRALAVAEQERDTARRELDDRGVGGASSVGDGTVTPPSSSSSSSRSRQGNKKHPRSHEKVKNGTDVSPQSVVDMPMSARPGLAAVPPL